MGTETFGNSECPSEEILAAFHYGDADKSNGELIGEHARSCNRCAAWLREAQANDALLSDLNGHEAVPTSLGNVGPYRLLTLLGKGGMGEVYLAEQESPIRRLVALKLIKRGMDTARVIERFKNEREKLARMSHRNVARVLDAGETDQGKPYFVMEYIPGTPINTYCSEEALDIEGRLRLFVDVCKGIQHAHQKGAIHRDIKPSNILVMEEDGKPVPKVIDFGIARATEDLSNDLTMMTELGQPVGTLAYMSPEQASGVRDIDERADIYSLGVVLYELLSDRLPLNLPKGTDIDELRRIIREQNPPLPSVQVRLNGAVLREAPKRLVASSFGRSWARRLRGDLDKIVMACLKKERRERYDRALDLSDDIERHLRHEPIRWSPPPASDRAKKFILRHKIAVSAFTLIFLTLVIATSATLLMYLDASASNNEKAKLLVERYAEAGRNALRRGEWNAALINFDDAISAGYQNEIEMRLGKIEAWVGLSQVDFAYSELKSLSLLPNLESYEGEVLLWKADALLNEPISVDERKEMIGRAIEAGLSTADAAYARGLVSTEWGEAESHFREAIRSNPYHHRSHARRGATLMLLGRLDEARSAFQYARQLFPNDPSPRFGEAVVLTFQRDLIAGRELLEQSRSSLGDTTTNQAIMVLQLINSFTVEDFWWPSPPKEAVPALIVNLALLSQTAGVIGDSKSEVSIVGSAWGLPAIIEKFLAPLLKATMAASAGDHEGAAATMAKACESHSEGTILLIYARSLAKIDRLEEAERVYLEAHARPSLMNVHRPALVNALNIETRLLQRNRLDSGVRARAGENLRRLIRLGTLPPKQYAFVTEVAIEFGEFDAAAYLISEWQREAPEDAEIPRLEVMLALGTKAYASALQTLDAVLLRKPSDSWALEQRSIVLASLERWQRDQGFAP